MKPIRRGLELAAILFVTSSPALAADAGCNRECLAGVMTTYLQALVKHDPSALPMTRNVKYTENGVRLNVGDGLWQTASQLPTYRVDVIDDEASSVGLIGRIVENGNNNWYGVRLLVEPDHKVSQIEVLVNRNISGAAPGSAGGAPPRQNTEAHPLMAQVIPADRRSTRAELARIGNTYFTGLDTEESSRGVPFDPACQRRENGTVTANNPDAPQGSMAWLGCKAQFDTGFSTIVTDIRERRFEVVDRTTGLAFGWGYFDHNGTAPQQQSDRPGSNNTNTFRQPFSFYIAEVFKVVDGKIRQIEAVLTTVPFQMESGW
jgi:hypothetical protein